MVIGHNSARLDYIRIYGADPIGDDPQSIFDVVTGGTGGGHALSSTQSVHGTSVCSLAASEQPAGFCSVGAVPGAPSIRVNYIECIGIGSLVEYGIGWNAVPNANNYQVFKNNALSSTITGTFDLVVSSNQVSYKVRACNSQGCGSFSNVLNVGGSGFCEGPLP